MGLEPLAECGLGMLRQARNAKAGAIFIGVHPPRYDLDATLLAEGSPGVLDSFQSLEDAADVLAS
jgi:hypothetical protein